MKLLLFSTTQKKVGFEGRGKSEFLENSPREDRIFFEERMYKQCNI
jgi:hypothetical protein